MLTSGMVPALYNDEEKEQVIGQVGQNYIVFLHIFILGDRGHVPQWSQIMVATDGNISLPSGLMLFDRKNFIRSYTGQ